MIRIIEYASPDEYAERLLSLGDDFEQKGNLLLGIALQVRREMEHYSDRIPYMVIAENNEKPVTVGLMTPPHKLLLYALSETDHTALYGIASHCRSRFTILPGVIAETGLALRFCKVWSPLTHAYFVLSMSMRMYFLYRIMDYIPVPGTMRSARESDRELLRGWLERFYIDIYKTAESSEIREQIDGMIERKELYLWEDGEPVSMARKCRPTLNSMSINSVYTPPQFRRKGYATSCTGALSRLIISEEKKYCVLFTDLANPVSNSLYQKIGYEPAIDFSDYTFKAKKEPSGIEC